MTTATVTTATVLLALAFAPAAQRPPTVGDTTWATLAFRVPNRMIIRPQSWDLGDLGQVLGPPEVVFVGESATVRYPLVLWYPGTHTLDLPGPIVVSPEGRSDTLPSGRVVLEIASVLPSDSNRAGLAPAPAEGTLPQGSRSLLPLATGLLVGAAVYGLSRLAVRAVRRRRERTGGPPVRPSLDLPPLLRRWAALGELRAAIDGWARLVQERGRSAAGLPPRAAAWVEAADRAGFRGDSDVAELERLLATVPEAGTE